MSAVFWGEGIARDGGGEIGGANSCLSGLISVVPCHLASHSTKKQSRPKGCAPS